MWLFSELLRLIVHEWLAWRWWFLGSAVVGVLLFVDGGRPLQLVLPGLLVAGVWLLRVAIVLIGMALGATVGFGLRPLVWQRQNRKDDEREMRRPPFEQL